MAKMAIAHAVAFATLFAGAVAANAPIVVSATILFPQPASVTLGADAVALTTIAFAGCDGGSPIVRRACARYAALKFAWPLPDGAAGNASTYAVSVVVGNASEVLQLSTLDERYTLTLTPDGGAITSPSVWGCLRALETLSQLVVHDPLSRSYGIPYAPVHVKDHPRKPWRRLMLDTSRRFYPLPYLLHTLDAMAQNKLNVFHWHATDAISAPLVSTRYPNLAAFGAFNEYATY